MTTTGGCAFGVRFVGSELPGLIRGRCAGLPTVTVESASASAIEGEWSRSTSTEVLFARDFGDGRPFLRVERDAGIGYRVWADGHGTHLIDLDGRRSVSALPEVEWRALKLLASQSMPLVSVLRGREVMHAAGVVVEGRLLALMAPSGTGKSTTAAHLIARGGRFFADDVLALELTADAVRAHPGSQMANLHVTDFESVPADARQNLGAALGQSDKLHLATVGHPEPLPLHAVLFLSRGGEASETTVSTMTSTALPLLGNAFLPYLDLPQRLEHQLEVADTLARTVVLKKVEIGSGDGPAAVAGRIEAWLSSGG